MFLPEALCYLDDSDPLVHDAHNSSLAAPFQMFIFLLPLPFSVLLGLAKLNNLLSLLTSNTLLVLHKFGLEGMFLLHSKWPSLVHPVLCKAKSSPRPTRPCLFSSLTSALSCILLLGRWPWLFPILKMLYWLFLLQEGFPLPTSTIDLADTYLSLGRNVLRPCSQDPCPKPYALEGPHHRIQLCSSP